MKMQLASILGISLATALISAQLSCGDPKVAGGKIVLQNDILDKEYNSFRVDQVVTQQGATGFSAVLKPGDRVTIPHKHVRALRFTRQYKDHDSIYEVTCPSDFDRATTVKLIDVHTNRLSGGCELRRRGTQEHGKYVKWE